MKKSELKKLIKEELLNELNIPSIQRMNGLIKESDFRKIYGAITSILQDLTEEGFEESEIKEFITIKIDRFLK